MIHYFVSCFNIIQLNNFTIQYLQVKQLCTRLKLNVRIII